MFTPVPSILAGKYRLIGELGRGGMGTVWRAEHLTLRSQVAIKLLGAEIARYPEAMDRFLREAQAAAALRSPHVVQVLDYGEDAGVAFIAMELLEGESLGARLRRVSHLSAQETSKLLGQVARALQRAHEAQIVHRDLKPDNIFIVRDHDDELAKVLDFGIAKSGKVTPTHQTRGGVRLGTPDYMSPEQVSATREVDFRSDLWAFGVIAFECLTGKHPFERETPEQLFYAICSAPLPVPSEHGPVPKGFDAWFAKICARDPALRFKSAMDAAAELATVSAGKPAAAKGKTQVAPAAKGVQARQPTNRFKSRRRMGTILGVGAGVISLIGVAALVAYELLRKREEVVSLPAEPPPPISVKPEPPRPAAPEPEPEPIPLAPSPIEPAPDRHNGPDTPPELRPPREEPEGKPFTGDIGQCFRACDVPARECERSCKATNCDLAATCFRTEADCDLKCYRDTVAGFRNSPPERCKQTCSVLDQRCRSRTCGNSSVCSQERCEPVRRDCEQSCAGASPKK